MCTGITQILTRFVSDRIENNRVRANATDGVFKLLEAERDYYRDVAELQTKAIKKAINTLSADTDAYYELMTALSTIKGSQS